MAGTISMGVFGSVPFIVALSILCIAFTRGILGRHLSSVTYIEHDLGRRHKVQVGPVGGSQGRCHAPPDRHGKSFSASMIRDGILGTLGVRCRVAQCCPYFPVRLPCRPAG